MHFTVYKTLLQESYSEKNSINRFTFAKVIMKHQSVLFVLTAGAHHVRTDK